MFNGNSSTGCSYDPYTANATRTVTDLTVAGAVGAYPLQWDRIMNSRRPNFSANGFAGGGGWSHSYDWQIPVDEEFSGPNPGAPTSYSVSFPDGRGVTFSYSASDPYFRGPAGVKERFQPLNLTTKRAYLILADGGKIEFLATKVVVAEDTIPVTYTSFWTYQPVAVIDPYGLRTVLSYVAGKLDRVTEPAGRWLQFTYDASNRISQVDARYGAGAGTNTQSVSYTYATQPFGGTNYQVLTTATYLTDAGSPSATYTYQTSNLTANGPPLIATCNDLHYDGPMKSIAYDFERTAPLRVYGQLWREKHVGGTVVVTLTITGTNTRTETRGDGPSGVGPSRTFTYANGRLTASTDFKNASAGQHYDTAGYVDSVTDRRGNTTNFASNALTGGNTLTTFPLTQPDSTRATVATVYGSASCPDVNNQDGNNPYYAYSVTNERVFTTTYTRNANKRITRIDYPDTSYETFTYNSFGQVLSHRMTSGGTETFEYDARGMKTAYRDPYHQTGNPTARYQYNGSDRLWKVTDARGTSIGDPNYTVTYASDPTGRVTKVTNPGGSYSQSSYNTDGTLAWTADENHPGAATDRRNGQGTSTMTISGHERDRSGRKRDHLQLPELGHVE